MNYKLYSCSSDKGTAMETKFALAGSNLVVAYVEICLICRYLHYFHNYIHKICQLY